MQTLGRVLNYSGKNCIDHYIGVTIFFYIVLVGDFPCLIPVLQNIVQGNKRPMSSMLLNEAASKHIQERCKEGEPGKVI